MATWASMVLAEESGEEASVAASRAVLQVSRAGRHIGQEAIQLHGGIGVTAEYAIGTTPAGSPRSTTCSATATTTSACWPRASPGTPRSSRSLERNSRQPVPESGSGCRSAWTSLRPEAGCAAVSPQVLESQDLELDLTLVPSANRPRRCCLSCLDRDCQAWRRSMVVVLMMVPFCRFLASLASTPIVRAPAWSRLGVAGEPCHAPQPGGDWGSSRRSRSRSRTSSGVSCARCRWSRAMMAPVAATPATPARPTHFHSFTRNPFMTLTLDQAVDLTRTGDLWLFRGNSAADHAIRVLTTRRSTTSAWRWSSTTCRR